MQLYKEQPSKRATSQDVIGSQQFLILTLGSESTAISAQKQANLSHSVSSSDNTDTKSKNADGGSLAAICHTSSSTSTLDLKVISERNATVEKQLEMALCMQPMF